MNELRILLVEDNEGDIFMISEALGELSVPVKLVNQKDGQLAIEYLSGLVHCEARAFPDLILLDINLPKKNGHEVLQFIKSHDQLKHIPVIMLTTSAAPEDVLFAYQNYASSYVTKSSSENDLSKVMELVEDFWVNLARLPSRH
ncbi:response regulator [Lunatimonas salinarum]|uniref:response regulator n=1 Tax=Lunatimonas salinarum TaxID=1774590 RepID=UPI001ADF83DA|nr:response regulator [Lunatimonas salinarum]